MSKTTPLKESQEGSVTVELWIESTVYEAAMTRATHQGEALASVARAALFAAAATAKPVQDPKIKPRPYGEARERIRFRVPRDRKDAAWRAIEASGVGVPQAVEGLLKVYVDMGTIINPTESE